MVVDEAAQCRFPASGSEDHLLGVSKDTLEANAKVRETCSRANHFGSVPPLGGGLGPALKIVMECLKRRSP